MINLLKLLIEFYKNAKNKNKILLYLLLAAISKILSAILQLKLTTWFKLFFDIINILTTKILLEQLLNFALLMTPIIFLSFIAKWLSELIAVKWSRFLTDKLTNKYLEYVENSKPFPNDVPLMAVPTTNAVTVSKNTLELLIDFIGVTTKLSLATVTLWQLSGTLPVKILGLAFNLHGYLLIVLALYAVISILLSMLIAKKYSKQLNKAQLDEGPIRDNLQDLAQFKKSINLEKGNAWFSNKLSALYKNFRKILKSKALTEALIDTQKIFYKYFTKLLPYLAASPLLILGLINLGTFIQISFLFDISADAILWFSRSLKTFSNADNAADTIKKVLTGDSHPTKNHNFTEGDNPKFDNFEFKKNTVITGPNGCGKSSLLGFFSNNYPPNINNNITITYPKNSMFINSKPYLPRDTLKQALLYPNNGNMGKQKLQDQELQEVLELIGLEAYKDKLNVNVEQLNLSDGQKQLVGLARIFLTSNTINWLLLDEATSALTPDQTEKIYKLIEDRFPDTKILTVSHREVELNLVKQEDIYPLANQTFYEI